MKLPRIWETSLLHEDIERGVLTEASFAVEFWAVLAGRAPKVYMDPMEFFAKTYKTSDLRAILVNALRRTARGTGSPVAIISTEFGGGKTHAMISLYHTFRSPDEVKPYLEKWGVIREADVLSPPKASVVVFDGRNVSPSAIDRPRTLWGVLADQLGRYADVERYDKEGKPPVLDLINQVFLSEEPVVFLLDELVYYLANAESEEIGRTTLARLTVNFLMALMTAVAHSQRSLLLLTLTGEQAAFRRYVDEIARKAKARMSREEQEELEGQLRVLAGDLQSMAARISSFGAPVRAEEVYGVVRTRLFREVDEEAAEKAAKDYFSYYHARAEHFPERSREAAYLERLRKSYPIHPELIDILYERISTIPDFQKTRGLLRLLALILRDEYKKAPEDAYYLMPHCVDLTHSEVLGELTDKLGRGQFRPVIAGDIVRGDGGAKSQRIDSRLEVKMARKAATALYLYSLIGAGRESGATLRDLNLCLLDPKKDPTPAATALDALRKELWFLQESGAMYFFTVEPNINAVIDDYTKVVNTSDVKEEIQKTLQNHFPKAKTFFTPLIWTSEVSDSKEAKLVVVDYEKGTVSDDEPPHHVTTLYDRVAEAGQLRTFKNTVFFLVCQEGLKEQMMDDARRYAAVIAAEKDERIRMDKAFLKKLLAKKSEAKTDLNAAVTVAYRYLYYPGEGGLKALALAPISGRKTLGEVCYEALKDRKIFETLNPDAIVDKLDPWRQKEEPTVTDILDMFKTYPDLPLPKTDMVIFDTLKSGVANSVFGYRDGRRDYLGESVTVRADGKIIGKEDVKKPPSAPPGRPPTGVGPTPAPTMIQVTLRFEDLSQLDRIDPSKGLKMTSLKFRGGSQVATVASQFNTLALRGVKGYADLNVSLGDLLTLSGRIPINLFKLGVAQPINSLSRALKMSPDVEVAFKELEGAIADDEFKEKLKNQAELLFRIEQGAEIDVVLS